MKKKVDYKYIWARTKAMLLSPRREWPAAHKEDIPGKRLFQEYLLPLAATGTACVAILLLIRGNGWTAVSMAAINLISVLAGWFVTYRLTREYLDGKLGSARQTALYLATYGYGVYIVFHCLSDGFSGHFLGQVMEVASFLCVHTLYVGLETLPELNAKHRNNVLIMTAVLMLVIPAIAERLLTIVFRIPTLYA